MGEETPGGGASPVGTGGKSCPTRSHFPHDLVVHPPDGRGNHQAVASAGICRRCAAFPTRPVGSIEPQRVPVAFGASGQTPKKVPETDAIFANVRERDRHGQDEEVMRLSMDGKATVNIGDDSRGGKTRGDHRAADQDMECEEKHMPFGIVHEDSGSLPLSFGSSAKTAISSSTVSTPSGSVKQPRSVLASHTSQRRPITDRRAMAGARNFSNTSSSSPITSASPSASSTIRRTTANTIRWSVAGESWKSTGTAPS